jgi:hypothetical protein
MLIQGWKSLLRRTFIPGTAAILAIGMAHAQSTPLTTQTDSAGAARNDSSAQQNWSSSLQTFSLADSDSLAGLPSSSDPSGSGASGAAGQTADSNRGFKHSLSGRWVYEVGGGFNAPLANDTPFITWGGNVTAGAGLRFGKMFSLLGEYQFMDDKLPGAFIASVNSDDTSGTPVVAGDAHINSVTASPVIDLAPGKSNGAYLVGGFGYYHKSTNFNGYECCAISYYGYYDVAVTLASVSSNQWGGNAGFGLYHRFGSLYGGDSKTQLFAEARYTFLHTPPITQSNGFGTTELIPVTIGLRF